MNCQQVRNYLLTADRLQPMDNAVSQHLQRCADCRAYAAQLNSAMDWLTQQPAPTIPAPIEQRLRHKLFENKKKSRLAPALALAVFIALIAAFFTLRPGTPARQSRYLSANEFNIESIEYHGRPLTDLHIVLNKNFINVFVTSGGKNHE